MNPCRWLFVVTLALPTFAFADIHSGDQTIAAELGPVIPLTSIDLTNAGGGTSKVGSAGFSGGGQYVYNVTPKLGLGADFNYSGTGSEDSSLLVPNAHTTTSYKSAVFLVVARLNLIQTGPAVPYLLSGLGFHSTTLHLAATPAPGFSWRDTLTTEQRDLVNDSQSGVAFGLGGGVDYDLSKALFLGVEARYQYLGNATYNATPNTTALTGVSAVKGSFGMINLFARLGYKFGAPEVEAPQGRAAPEMAPATYAAPAAPAVPAQNPAPAAPAQNAAPVPAAAPETSDEAPVLPANACPFLIQPGQSVSVHLKSRKTSNGKLVSCDSGSLQIHSGLLLWTYDVDEVATVDVVP